MEQNHALQFAIVQVLQYNQQDRVRLTAQIIFIKMWHQENVFQIVQQIQFQNTFMQLTPQILNVFKHALDLP